VLQLIIDINVQKIQKQNYLLSIEGRSSANRIHRQVFCSCDLEFDLDPMTLIYKPDLYIPKLHTKNGTY